MGSVNLPHASISSIMAYSDCGKRWEFKYVHRLPEKSKLAMKIGSTNHAILESVNHWIKEKKTEPDRSFYHNEIEQLVKISLPLELFDEVKRTSKADKALSDEEFFKQERDQVIEQLRKMCNIYIDQANEKFEEIVLIEKAHVLDISGIPFKMVTDAVVRFKDGTLRVLDYKTKAKGSTDIAILQLIGYAIGIEDLLKEEVHGLEQWDFIKKTEPELIIHSVDMKLAPSYRKVLQEEIPAFWNGVHGGMFHRNMRSMFCGPEKCDYWNVCMQPGKLEESQKSIAEFHGHVIKNMDQRRTN